MGLTNARVSVYRRVDPLAPKYAPVRGPCGLLITEKLLLPNHGRDAAAFADWALEHYDAPPMAVVFLHGHGPYAWHTTCQAIVTRTRLAYSHYANAELLPSISQHVVSLTRLEKDEVFPLVSHDQRQDIDTHRGTAAYGICEDLLRKYNMSIPTHKFSCCSMFIAPGQAIRRHPKSFWAELRSMLLRQDVDDWSSGRVCFECARACAASVFICPSEVPARAGRLTAPTRLAPALLPCEVAACNVAHISADIIYMILGEPLQPLEPYIKDFYVKVPICRSCMSAAC